MSRDIYHFLLFDSGIYIVFLLEIILRKNKSIDLLVFLGKKRRIFRKAGEHISQLIQSHA
ncbi:hypothetical protein BSL056_20085 [Bacillus safensis]|nr:hypothetical protein BSL056_20085 [Bacillus safensis]